jgi:thiamine pyrophosphokinase
MKALLFIGGEAPERIDDLLKDKPFVCAADSGLLTALRWGLVPELIVGDMDSLPDASLLSHYPEEKVLVFPRDKDETDTEIGVRLLSEAGFGDISLIGGGGGRLDHLIAILALLERPEGPKEWFTALERIDVVEGEFSCEAEPGEIISIFPLGTTKARVKSEGLKWRLDDLEWGKGNFSVSNEASEKTVSIRVLSGALMVVRRIPIGS